MTSEKKTCILMGDFNINLLNANSHIQTSNFFNAMCNFFIPHILQPTRITEQSKTLIDNIFVNNLEYNTSSGNLTSAISDHLIQFLLIKNFKEPFHPSTKVRYQSDFKNFNNEIFSGELKSFDWHNLLNSHYYDVNEMFYKFYDKLNEILDRHAPLRKLSKKELSFLERPWISKEIKNLMYERDKYYKKLCKEKDNERKSSIRKTYKVLSNQVVFLTNQAKRKYYESFFENNKSNISQMWKGIKSLITLNSKNNYKPTTLKSNGILQTNPTVLANAFNEFFGPTLSKTIPSINTQFTAFLKNRILE